MPCELGDLTDLAACRAVVDLQVEVWGRDSETVPASLLLASIKRGGILVGAWENPVRLDGFVWSMPGWRDGQPTHWSHMLGVRPSARAGGLGEALKRAQRDRALAAPAAVDLVEWTFDPLQAVNAHLNFARLGAIASEYRVNAYGEMVGPLHRGTATDRLVAEWWIRRPHVVRRLEAARGGAAGVLGAVRNDVVRDAPVVIETTRAGEWLRCGAVRTNLEAERLLVPVPARFSDMQQQETALAQAWRQATREAFTSYFARGYRAVDFLFDREMLSGAYLVTRAAT